MSYNTSFNDENFDPELYLQNTLKPGSAQSYEAERARLKEQTTTLDKRLHKEVADNFPKLKEQVQTVQDLHQRVDVLQASAASLKQSVSRTRQHLAVPYAQVQHKVAELENIWETADVLRKLSRCLSLLSKAREQQAAQEKALQQDRASAATLDLPKEAKTLREVELAMQENDGYLQGVDVVQREVDWLKSSIEKARHRAHELLKHGLAGSNQAEIRTALQAYYNMDILPKVAQKLFSDHGHELRKLVTRELDVQAIYSAAQASATPEEPVEHKIVPLLFSRLEEALKAIVAHASKLAQLVRVLNKTRDPVTQDIFISHVQREGGCLFLDEVWKPVVALEDRFPRLASRFQVLVTEYPRVHQKFEQFIQNVTESFPAATGAAVAPTAHPEAVAWKDRCVGELQSKYLAAAAARLKDKAALIFKKVHMLRPKDPAAGGAPILPNVNANAKATPAALMGAVTAAQVDIRPFTAGIHQELVAAQAAPQLQQLLCVQVREVVEELHSKCAKERITGRSVTVVGAVATNNQLFNSVLAIALMRLHAEVGQILDHVMSRGDDVDTQPQDALLGALAAGEESGEGIMRELLSGVDRYLEQPLCDVLTAGGRGRQNYNPCLTNFGERWQRVERFVLVLYTHTPLEQYKNALRKSAQGMADTFLRLVSLVRPYSDEVRVALTADVTQFQVAVGGMVPLEALGRSYKELRAFRTLLALDNAQLHAALASSGPPDSIALELNALSSLLLVQSIVQRVASVQGLPELLGKPPVEYVKETLTDPARAAAAEQAAWQVLREWGEAPATEDAAGHAQLWECVQVWHRKRMAQAGK
eukprot:TRINITY_DN6514_c0_g2_i1.p1 TRINITY_DN6514_c0_g2~~TRINITY_DN6514_c0_g2_i1.p1  ORF type:complete len:820 (+),score=295.24 TRINITY_DN6514_c0_g2_i1:53-2512(+)